MKAKPASLPSTAPIVRFVLAQSRHERSWRYLRRSTPLNGMAIVSRLTTWHCYEITFVPCAHTMGSLLIGRLLRLHFCCRASSESAQINEFWSGGTMHCGKSIDDGWEDGGGWRVINVDAPSGRQRRRRRCNVFLFVCSQIVDDKIVWLIFLRSTCWWCWGNIGIVCFFISIETSIGGENEMTKWA